ncbi:MAG: carbohydrate ABC transporter permease [Chloroflexia bacterium]|nr:carbohydrate ABC transporter permease [Chloroflexia bacterium]
MIRLTRHGSLTDAVRYVLYCLVALPFVLPVWWVIALALRPTGQPLGGDLLPVPWPPATENLGRVFEVVDFARFLANSAFVVAVTVPVTILVASWAGFALAQLPGRWRTRIVVLAIAVAMLPLTAIWLPRFILIRELGLIDNLWALTLDALIATSPFNVLIFLWSFARIPDGIYEAARLDGASAFRIWGGIAMPLARPTIIAVAVLTFAHHWSSFIEPALYLRSTANMTVTLGLTMLQQLDRGDWPVLMAGILIAIGPVVLAFLLSHRAFLHDVRDAGWIGR